jgi:hypothetical protein
MGIGSHIHVEVVTEEIAFPVGVPAPVAVRLGIAAFAITGRAAILFAMTDSFFPLLCGSTDRGAVTSQGQMFWIKEAFAYGTIQELLFIKPEDQKKRILWFELPVLQERKKFRCGARRIAGSLIALLLSLRRLQIREAFLRRKMV